MSIQRYRNLKASLDAWTPSDYDQAVARLNTAQAERDGEDAEAGETPTPAPCVRCGAPPWAPCCSDG